jgi:hypothetical protein
MQNRPAPDTTKSPVAAAAPLPSIISRNIQSPVAAAASNPSGSAAPSTPSAAASPSAKGAGSLALYTSPGANGTAPGNTGDIKLDPTGTPTAASTSSSRRSTKDILDGMCVPFVHRSCPHLLTRSLTPSLVPHACSVVLCESRIGTFHSRYPEHDQNTTGIEYQYRIIHTRDLRE